MTRITLATAFIVMGALLGILSWHGYVIGDTFTATALFTCALISFAGGILITKNKNL